MKKILFAVFLFFSIISLHTEIYCGNMEHYQSQFKEEETFSVERQIDFSEIDQIQNAISQINGTENINFKELLTKIIKGEIDLSPSGIIEKVSNLLFKEIIEFGNIMRNLLIVSILSALLKNLTESFKSKDIGELGFYVCYMVLIIIVFQAFTTAAFITKDLIDGLSSLMAASIPLIITLVMMSGNLAAPYVFSPTLAFLTNFLTAFINNFLSPLIILGAGMEIVNYLTEKEILRNFSELIKFLCSWLLKAIAFIFVSIIALQKISSPILNNLVGKAAKASMGVIPVVGGVLNEAVEMVTYWAQAVKSGTLVALVIVIALACTIPVLKIIAIIFTLKLTSALIEPVCDKRIVKCLDAIGVYSFLLLGCAVTVISMFILTVVIMLSF